jgi:hypothetical protein
VELIIWSIVGSVALLVAHLLEISSGSRAIADHLTIPPRSQPRTLDAATMTLTVPA